MTIGFYRCTETAIWVGYWIGISSTRVFEWWTVWGYFRDFFYLFSKHSICRNPYIYCLFFGCICTLYIREKENPFYSLAYRVARKSIDAAYPCTCCVSIFRSRIGVYCFIFACLICGGRRNMASNLPCAVIGGNYGVYISLDSFFGELNAACL